MATNSSYIQRSLLRYKIQVYFKPNLGDSLGVEQDITDYVVNVPEISQVLSKQAEGTGGILLSNLTVSLNNGWLHWDEDGKFFKNALVNNSLIGFRFNYIDTDGDEITPGFTFEGLIKVSSSEWSPVTKRFRAGLIGKLNVLSTNEIASGSLAPNSIKNTIYNMVNQGYFKKYTNIDLSNINPGIDIAGVVNHPEELDNEKVKDGLDTLCYLSGSVYYVDPVSNDFIVETITPTSPVSSFTFTKNDIFSVENLGYDRQNQRTAFKWGDAFSALDSELRRDAGYDYILETITDELITITANRQILTDNLLEIYKILKRRITLTVKLHPEIQPNDFIKIDLPKEVYQNDNFVWNANAWNDNKYWGSRTAAVYIDGTIFWRVLDVNRDIIKNTMTITVKEV